jgi:hypothetical protein
MTTAPSDPQSGDDILEWARKINALVRSIIPRKSADIAPQIHSTGTTFFQRRRPATPAGGPTTEEAFTINMASAPAIPASDFVDVEITIPGLTGTNETLTVSTGNQNNELALIQKWTEGDKAVLRFRNLSTSSPNSFSAADITVRVVR